MSGERVLFVERHGAIVEGPPGAPADGLRGLRLLPGVVPALLELQRAGYRLVLVDHHAGGASGSPDDPGSRETREFLRQLLTSQGISFDAELCCPHRPGEPCDCREPHGGQVARYLASRAIDLRHSRLVGAGENDSELAAGLGLEGLRVRTDDAAGSDWAELVERLCRPDRRARVRRRTRETSIEVEVALDRTSPVRIATGIGFFDHMLEQVARHGGFALELSCSGDLEVDEHHTVEDCALALGQALREALGDKRGIGRYGFLLAMDESQAQVAIDLSGRPYAVFDGRFGRESVGGLPTELVPHFFRSLADSLGAAIHVEVRGENAHHMIEACFKGVGRALRQALRVEGTDLPSSKGVL